MSRSARRGEVGGHSRGPRASDRHAPEPAPALPLRHPAVAAAALVAFACILFSVTFRLIDSDFWQHLLVGRVIWERHAISREHLWSWVSYGQPEVLPSWLFRAVLWPFHAWGGIEGLFAWRWLTTLAVFGLAWATARRMGARGLAPLVVLAWCALLYRARSQVRPETLAAVLMALQIWILESRRHGGRDRLAWLAPLACIWINAHVSFFLAFVLLAVHAVGAWWAGGRGGMAQDSGGPPWFAGVALAMTALCFANPFGWQAIWQPFDYALHLSQEPLFRAIGELQPMSLQGNLRTGAWLMIVGWPLLLAWRWRRRGFDPVESLTCLLATLYAVPSQRFLGVYAVAAAPYLARDLQGWIEARRWPDWTAAPVARAGLASAACVLIGIPEWLRPTLEPGVGVAMQRFPVAACDFMARHGIRGRGFQHFRFVGYQAWRFWPDRERLPFMDIHQSGTPADRAAFAAAFTDPASWPELARRYRLDYVMLDRRQPSGVALLDVLDADSAWALVFLDDTAALYLRRDGALAAVADSLAFHWLGGGEGRLVRLAGMMGEDARVRPALRAELERAAAASPWNATALALLANLELADGRTAEARRHLEAALRVDPRLPGAHQRLGVVALWENRPRDAIGHFERELELGRPRSELELGLGMAYEQAGDFENARRHYQRELELDPGSEAARARLEEVRARGR